MGGRGLEDCSLLGESAKQPVGNLRDVLAAENAD
jgi:hypothetical protein